MPVLRIRDHIFIDFDDRANKIYWTKLSEYILNKYGPGPFSDSETVIMITNDSFDFLIYEFNSIIQKETSRTFYNYVFTMMESGIQLWQEFISGQPLEKIEETDFASHQRTLRLILEQATEVNIKTDSITSSYMPMLIRKLEDLIYLGYWIYGCASIISEIKIVGNCYEVDFDENNVIGFGRKEPYNFIFDKFTKEIISGYSEGIFDEVAFNDLRKALNDTLGIDYGPSISLALELKKYICSHNTDYCTYPFHLLPQNYSNFFKLDYKIAEDYYSGLTISKRNKLTTKDSVLKAHSLERYFYRPILELNIDSEDRVLVSFDKVSESIVSLSINAINWNKAPHEWMKNKKFKQFIQNKAALHDKILEDHIENILKNNNIYYDRNVISLKPLNGPQVRIDIPDVGEIDFIYLDTKYHLIVVADSKYHVTRYDMMAHRADFSNFVNEYEPKLQNKINYLSSHKKLIEEHFENINGRNIDLKS